jgi:archaellum component FlaC
MPKAKSTSSNANPDSPKNVSGHQGKNSLTPEQRYQMIAEAAYFHAEKRGFAGGDAMQDWLEAEAEIDRIFQDTPTQGKQRGLPTKQDFQQKLENQLKEWDEKLRELKDKIQTTTSDLHGEYHKQLETLMNKRATVHAKIQELSQRTEDAWVDLKGGTEKAWDDMREALERIASRYK